MNIFSHCKVKANVMNADWWTLAALDIVKVKANVMSAGHWRHADCFQNNRWRCNASNAIFSWCFPIIKKENIFFHWPLNSAFIEVPDEMFKMNLSRIFLQKYFLITLMAWPATPWSELDFGFALNGLHVLVLFYLGADVLDILQRHPKMKFITKNYFKLAKTIHSCLKYWLSGNEKWPSEVI